MSEASQCDRCSRLTEGSPHSSLMLADGVPRTSSFERGRKLHREGEPVFDTHLDMCQSCRNDLMEWWSEADGDVSDILEDPLDSDNWEEEQ